MCIFAEIFHSIYGKYIKYTDIMVFTSSKSKNR